jgi:hypothetical protein
MVWAPIVRTFPFAGRDTSLTAQQSYPLDNSPQTIACCLILQKALQRSVATMLHCDRKKNHAPL